MSDTTRRAVLVGAAGITTATVLAACGDEEAPATNPTGGAGSTGDTGSTGSGATAGAAALAKTSDIPVNGGKIFKDGGGVVVTQPTAGQFKAFDAACTHQGCAVTSVANGLIDCKCHGSQFSVLDGSVKAGPANKPLPPKSIKVDGDSITLA